MGWCDYWDGGGVVVWGEGREEGMGAAVSGMFGV